MRVIGGSVVFFLVASIGPSPAIAQETQAYTYDALGRLTEVSKTRASHPTAPIVSSTQYDPAGNRTVYATTGAPGLNGTGQNVVVLPLLGYVVIPISQ